jgi:hypothetical protein
MSWSEIDLDNYDPSEFAPIRCCRCGADDEIMFPGKPYCICCGPHCDCCGESTLDVGDLDEDGWCKQCLDAEAAERRAGTEALKSEFQSAINAVRTWVEGE